MASAVHLALVRGGAHAIAEWRRRQTPGQRSGPDLSGAALEGARLRGADLEFADMSGAAASKADFSRAILRHAKLATANLADADLSDASCEGADLAGASLRRAMLRRTKLTGADLRGANLMDAFLPRADLSGARLDGADLSGAHLPLANLTDASLDGANLTRARLSDTRLTRASLRGANLTSAQFIQADLTGAMVSGCRIFGIAAWGLTLDGATQNGLIVTPPHAPEIAVDDLEVAQFVYLLLNNAKIRHVIDTVGKKGVLILGRFTPERKIVLEAVRERLRHAGYVPIMFDFDRPGDRDLTETVTLLARLARFIVVDLTSGSSIPKELEAIVPTLAIPVQPLLHSEQNGFSMFPDYWKYDWVLPVHRYVDCDSLMNDFPTAVIAPAEDKAKQLAVRRALAMG